MVSWKIVYIEQLTDHFNEVNVQYEVYNLDDIANLKKEPGYTAISFKKDYENRIVKEFNTALKFQKALFSIEIFFKKEKINLPGIYNKLTDTIIDNQTQFYKYRSYFKKSGFKKILFYCYYNSAVMAINRAARELNIDTIEYQHSQISSNHFAYSGWTERIRTSDFFFPRIF